MKVLAGLVLLVVLAVLPEINAKVSCGVRVTNLEDGGRKATYKWPQRSLTYTITKYPMNTQLTRSDVDASVQWAFKAWTWYINMTITKANYNEEADFDISFGYVDGPSNTIGYAYYPPEGKIIFEEGESWYMAAKPGYINFNWVTLHEIGHALGLDHTDDSASAMYPSYQRHERPMPTHSDFQTIANMYGLKTQYRNRNFRMGR